MSSFNFEENNGPLDYVPIFTLDKEKYLNFHHKVMVQVGTNTIKLDPNQGVFWNDVPINGGDVDLNEIVMSGLDRKIRMNVVDGLVFSLCPGGGAIDPCPDTIYNSVGNFGVRLNNTSSVTIGGATLGETLLTRLGSYLGTPNLVMPTTSSIAIGNSVLGKSEIDYINVTVPVEISNVNTRVDVLNNTLVATQSRVGVLETWRGVVDTTLSSYSGRLSTLESGFGSNSSSITTWIGYPEPCWCFRNLAWCCRHNSFFILG
jgi:hypothetical protein